MNLRLFGHPLHAAFVHFPIALLGTSLIFDLVGLVSGEPMWWILSFWNIALGLVFGAATAGTGLVDSMQVEDESGASKTLLWHMGFVFLALCAYGGALAVRGGPGVPDGTLPLYGTLALELLGFSALILGGWFGGELVYRHRVGQPGEVKAAREGEGEVPRLHG